MKIVRKIDGLIFDKFYMITFVDNSNATENQSWKVQTKTMKQYNHGYACFYQISAIIKVSDMYTLVDS